MFRYSFHIFFRTFRGTVGFSVQVLTAPLRWVKRTHQEWMVYPPVNSHNYGKPPFLLGKSTIDGHFQ